MRVWSQRYIACWLVCLLGLGFWVGCEDESKGDGTTPGVMEPSGEPSPQEPSQEPEAEEPASEPEGEPEGEPVAEPTQEPDAEPEGPLPGSFLIEPTDLELRLAPGAMEDVEFRASVVEEDGTLTVIDDGVWEADRAQLGPIDRETGLFRTLGTGGRIEITWTRGADVATTSLTVIVEDDLVVGGADPAAPAEFEGAAAGDPASAPSIIYPEHGTMIPQNIRGVTVQWNGGTGDTYRVRVRNEFLNLSVYTRENIWAPDNDLWTAIVRSGGRIDVNVDSLAGGTVHESVQDVEVNFAPDNVEGAVYYWSTTDFGIMRLPVGELEPERFFTPSSPAGSPCSGCHALSRDGTRMAFNTAPVGIPIGPLMQISTEDPTVRIIDLTQGINGMQPTFSPQGDRIVSGWGGTLTERYSDGRCMSDNMFCESNADCAMDDCVSGIPIRDLPSPEGYSVAFPDWAPDNRWLVAAGTDNVLAGIGVDFSVSNGSLILYPNLDGEWAEPLVIVEPATPNENNYHPAFSPDSAWIAYNFSPMSVSGGDNGGIIDAELRMLSPVGRDPIELTRANQGPDLGNSWPKWAPFDGRYLWLSFSSFRPYGNIQTDGTPQIWVTAIDTARAANGEDPSFPAFWLPGQAPESGNHIPYWTRFTKNPDLGADN